MGVDDVRLTGGEPLVRRDFPRLVGDARRRSRASTTSRVTTNGYLLERDAEALVRRRASTRFNVSIDSLQRDRFFEMTRRDALPQVLAGLEALARLPRGAPDQGQRRRACAGFTEDEVLPLRRASPASTPTRCASSSSCRSTPTTPGRPTACSPATRSARSIHAVYPLEPSSRASRTRPRASTASPTAAGAIGFINPVSEPFCGDCNRIRLTAEGKLRTCLFSLNETDLREPLRAGADDAELEQIIRDAVWRKELKHHVNEPGFVAARAHDERDRRLGLSGGDDDELQGAVVPRRPPARRSRAPGARSRTRRRRASSSAGARTRGEDRGAGGVRADQAGDEGHAVKVARRPDGPAGHSGAR